MTNENPIQTARRASRREDQDRCLLCGRSKRIEQHHVAGRNHDPAFTTPLCEACHALATENLRRADVSMRYERDSVARIGKALKALSIFLRMLAEALWRWAECLLETRSS